MIVLFWVLQALLAAVLIVPTAIIVIGGSEGFNEFAEWIIGFFLVVGTLSLIAQLLRRSGRVSAGASVLLLGLTPFLLLLWFLISFAANFHN